MANMSIADALFTTTQKRVLGLLFGQPDKSFFFTQIVGLAGSGRGAVQRELKKLSDCGLVTVTHIATQKHYQANPASPLYNELCGIVQKTIGLREPVTGVLAPFAEEIDIAFIYGSVAAGSDRADSDIDLMVVSDSVQLEDLIAALRPAEDRLGRSISPMLLTTSEFAKRQKKEGSFVARVLGGPRIALIGELDDE